MHANAGPHEELKSISAATGAMLGMAADRLHPQALGVDLMHENTRHSPRCAYLTSHHTDRHMRRDPDFIKPIYHTVPARV